MQVCRINCDVAPWSIRRKRWILFRLRLRPALLMANDYALHSLVSYHQMTQRKHGTGLFIYSVNYFDLLSELSNGHFKSAWRLMQMTNECAANKHTVSAVTVWSSLVNMDHMFPAPCWKSQGSYLTYYSQGGLDDVAGECVEHSVDWSSARSCRNSSLTDLHHFKGMNSNLIRHRLESGVSRIPTVTFQNRNISAQLCGNLSTVSHYADAQLLCRSWLVSQRNIPRRSICNV